MNATCTHLDAITDATRVVAAARLVSASEAATHAVRNHHVPAVPTHQDELQDDPMVRPPCLYSIRIRGHLGTTVLSAFPTMVSEPKGSDTVLTGLLEDRSALFGVLAQIEALGLDLVEVRQTRSRPNPPEPGEYPLQDGV